ncbi:MAG: carboxypeptidase regulatory-like domain-containing protein [Armatimonadetes bacterium]|nr:carboxypeptidase regulatory-like domain-containing protein [Armatimonadota bacterium]
MKSLFWALCLLVAGVLAGCGPGKLAVPGEISGNVFDQDGNTVRGATVSVFDGPSTQTTSSGNFVLRNVNLAQVRLRVNATDSNGLQYYGETYVPMFDGERSKNANVTIMPTNRIARLRGRVTTPSGAIVRGARIFCNSGGSTSHAAITGQDGEFLFSAIVGNRNYVVLAGGRGLSSDVASINVPIGQEGFVNLVVASGNDVAFTPPTGVYAVSWTTPNTVGVLSKDGQNPRDAYENVKRSFDKGRVARLAKRAKGITPLLTSNGSPIEVEIGWDAVDNTELLGFGVYRRFGTVGTFSAVDIQRDPLGSVFFDNDDNLVANQTYQYVTTKINVTYPDGSNSESGFSNVVTANTLDDLLLDPVTFGPLTFRWRGGSGATQYAVYLYDRYPGVNTTFQWTSEGSPTNNLFQPYTGGSLISGRTYYFLVLGFSNGGDSRTISSVGSFVAP